MPVLKSSINTKSPDFQKNSQRLVELLTAYKNEEEQILQGGGPKAIESQHKKSRLTARERVASLIDPGTHFFEVDGYEVSTHAGGAGPSRTTATVTLRVEDGLHSAAAVSHHGPFNALHLCLRNCLSKFYPQIGEVRLTDYKVRVLDSRKGTAAKVRVLIEWSDHHRSWSTVGVSDNVIEASWKALVDAIRLELMRLTERDSSIERAVEDYCWGV